MADLLPTLPIKPDKPIIEIDSELTLLTEYKTKLESKPEEIISEKIAKCDFHLGKGLGDSMRKHLINHKASLQSEPNKHIQYDLVNINDSITRLEIEKLDLNK